MANPNIAGLPGSWVQGSIAAIVGGSVGPIGEAVIPIPPPGDDFLLAIKPADTSRINTTTFADDPDLVITGLAAGIYAYELFLECFSVSSTPDIIYRLQESAGVMDGPRVGWEQFAGVPAAAEIKIPGGVDTSNDPNIVANQITWVHQFGYFTLTLAADVALQWAQDNLDAVNATTLNEGSWLRIEAANV